MWLILAAARMLSWLPLGLALSLAGILGRAGYYGSRRGRKRALGHLAVAMPEVAEAERQQIARGCFVHLMKATMEVVCIRQIDPQLEDYVELPDASRKVLAEALAEERGLVFVTGHLGNWELLARRFARTGAQPVVVARRSWNARLDEAMATFRQSGGVKTLWREEISSGRLLLRAMREGKTLGLLIDQDTRVRGLFVPFFGRMAYTPRAGADLALRFDAPLVVGWTRRRPGGKHGYVMEVERIAYNAAAEREAEVARITVLCTSRLEQVIRANPTEWVWMHRRWRTQETVVEPPPASELT
jgi:KDO2-lipid IV(A) lauroyltransferase